jgi:hypothetical protein
MVPMELQSANGRTRTVVADPAWVRPAFWLAGPVLGSLVGWGLKAIAGWVAALPWAPFQGPFKLITSIKEPYGLLGALALGLLAGLVLAYIVTHDLLTIAVSTDEVTFTRADAETTVERAAATAVFFDKKKIVILGAQGVELAREDSDLTRERVREAFVAHGFPWQDSGDPYAADFMVWVPDEPRLPVGANALFAAREKALSDDSNGTAAELRQELSKLGVVVREEKKRQYWRLVKSG